MKYRNLLSRVLGTVLMAVLFFASQTAFAQQGVVISTNSSATPDGSAILDLQSTAKGFLVPRMSQAQRDAIGTPATGLLIYQTNNTPGYYYWDGSAWQPVASSGLPSGSAGDILQHNGTSWVATSGSGEFIINGTTQQTSADFNIDGSGTLGGNINVTGNADITGNILGSGYIELDDSDNSHYTRIATGNQTSNITLTLPTTVGSSNQFLQTDGSGNLTWADEAGTVASVGAGNALTNSGTATDPVLDVEAGNGLSIDVANDQVEWGGTLEQATTISSTNFDITFSMGGNASDFIIEEGGTNKFTVNNNGIVDIGTSDGFQVNSNGNLIKIKGVDYDWPSSGASSNGQVLAFTTGGVASWVSPLTNPMNSAGDMIIGGAGGTAQELNSGTGVLINTGTSPGWSTIDLTNSSYTSGVPTGILEGSGGVISAGHTGTSGRVVKWTGSGSIANSLIRDDGSSIGINTAPVANTGIFMNSYDTGLYIDGATTSIQTESGGISSSLGSGNNNQIVFNFSQSGGKYPHAIKTRHQSTADKDNAIDFYVWDQGTDGVNTVGTNLVMSVDGRNGGALIIADDPVTASLASGQKLYVDGKMKSNGLNETSDARFKKDIQSIESGLEKVLAMRGVTYHWDQEKFPKRNFTDELQHGLIAQELEEIIPELVATDGDGYKSIQYSHLVPVLIEAIKEQQEVIEDQKSEISGLKASNTNVEEELKSLNEKLILLENMINAKGQTTNK